MGVESVGLMKQVISILGATGSIGDSTLDIVRRHRDQYEVFALAGNRQWQKLLELCVEFQPRYVVVMDEDVALSLKQGLQAACVFFKARNTVPSNTDSIQTTRV